jgi:hypothetical protein
MTREELAQRINSFERDNRRQEWPFLAVLIVGALSTGLLGARYADESPVIGWLCVPLMFAWILVPSRLLGRINKRRMKTLDLYCPHCNCSLAGPVGRLAVTTLFCSQCGKQIVETKNSEQDETQQPH